MEIVDINMEIVCNIYICIYIVIECFLKSSISEALHRTVRTLRD